MNDIHFFTYKIVKTHAHTDTVDAVGPESPTSTANASGYVSLALVPSNI